MVFKAVFTSAVIFCGLARSAPVPIEVQLAKRAEGIHLVNCFATGSAALLVSAVAYCPNDGSCNPGASDFCEMSSNDNDYYHWEGAKDHCTFSSGVTFSWNLPSNAQNQATYSVVE
ncbi:hypothetical protein BDV96DRAFT_602901 [Lophiotrema nucula]|uniref:Uncharacterized protein n=1 Tax=Lophiotrema nucula TaxID=690887 RepID=A0A6A5Z0K5_9PLEO|nr:hypothetical protein BDV96DRAFT_602901 [Lophiotrema nucula]